MAGVCVAAAPAGGTNRCGGRAARHGAHHNSHVTQGRLAVAVEAAEARRTMENDNGKKEEETETRLTYTSKDFFLSTTSMHGEDLTSQLDILLLRKWMAAKAAGAFIYSVDNVETKILPGKYGIVSQINVNRKLMRRKPENVVDIQQPFNPDKFNFTKIQDKEILMNLQFLSENPKEDTVLKKNVKETSVTLEATLIINNAPICHTHSLLVPFLEKCQPQVLNHQGLTTAIHTVLLSKSTDLRIAFNSLGGFASVNHLHFHLYYFPYTLYTETAECERLAGPCYIFKDHFAPGFVFQLENGDVDQLASSVMAVVNILLKEKVAHNLFITRGTPLEAIHTKGAMYSTVRVVLWARDFAYGAKDVSLFATAVCELAGHVPVYSLDQWDTLSENDLLPLITSVCRDDYEAILPKVTDVFQPNGIHDDGDEEAQYNINEEGDEGVKIDTGEPPHHRILARGGREGGKHVVSIDERVQALHCG